VCVCVYIYIYYMNAPQCYLHCLSGFL
jgi:hypothetical protein